MNAAHKLLAMMIVATGFSSSVAAQEAGDYHPILTSKFTLGAGVYFPEKNFNIQVDGSVPEEEIDFDQALKYDTSDATGSLTFRWRFGEKWSLSGQYWSLDSSGGTVLEEDIEWQDVVFKEGTFANGGADTTIGRIFLGRVFSSSARHEFGLGVGLHRLTLDSFLEGEIIVDEETTEFQRVSVDAAFPMPNIGGWYMYSWSPKWLFEARLDWLSASFGNYSGGILNAAAGVNYQAFKNIGIGLYYNSFNVDVDVEKSDWRGSAESKQNGPFIAVTATW
jgi:hypothetical protein